VARPAVREERQAGPAAILAGPAAILAVREERQAGPAAIPEAPEERRAVRGETPEAQGEVRAKPAPAVAARAALLGLLGLDEIRGRAGRQGDPATRVNASTTSGGAWMSSMSTPSPHRGDASLPFG